MSIPQITLYAPSPLQTQTPFFELQIQPEFEEFKKYLTNLDQIQGGGSHFVCGYEAGCLGYSLYKEIMGYNWKGFSVERVIMAPSTMASSPNDKMQKSDSILLLVVFICVIVIAMSLGAQKFYAGSGIR